MKALGDDVLASLNTASRAQIGYAAKVVAYRDALSVSNWDEADRLRPLILVEVESFLDSYAAAAMRIAREPER